MTDKRFLELEITAWLGSKERKRQLAGEAYYDGAQDVLRRKRIALDDDGKVKVLDLSLIHILGKHLGVFDANNGSGNEQENNIFEVIEESTREEIGTDEIPEIEPPAKPGHDLEE